MKKVNVKNLKFGINNTVIVVFAIVVVMLLNIVTILSETKMPHLKIDLTQDNVTKIGNETKKLLDTLEEGDTKIDVIYLKGTQDADEQVTAVLEQYDAYCDNITYSVVNYHTNPVLLNSYGINSDANVDGSVLVSNHDKSKTRIIMASDMETSYRNNTVFMLENLLTNAIGVVSGDKQMTVCFTTGHGEIIEQSSEEDGTAGGMMLIALLRSENIGVYQFDVSTGKIPENIDLVMIMSPERDFTSEEINNLDDYLLNGGNVAVSLSSAVTLDRLEGYLGTWGVRVNNDIISEADRSSRFDENGVYFYAKKAEHDIVNDIEGRVIASYAKSLEFEKTGDIEADVLLTSSENGLSMPIVNGAIDQADMRKGQFDIAYALEKPLNGSFEETAKMIVTSTESIWGVTRDTVTNYDAIVYNSLLEKSFGNAEFVMNTLSYVFGESVESIYVPVKTRQVSVLTMSQAQADIMSRVLGFVLPTSVILAGVIVWLKRRNK